VKTLEGLQFAKKHSLDFCEVSASSGEHIEVAMRRLIVTVGNSLIEQDERLSLPNLDAAEVAAMVAMPSLDSPERKPNLSGRRLPNGWVEQGGSYENTWTGERVDERPTEAAGQGKINFSRPASELEKIDVSVRRAPA
jgi:hypothetical protein